MRRSRWRTSSFAAVPPGRARTAADAGLADCAESDTDRVVAKYARSTSTEVARFAHRWARHAHGVVVAKAVYLQLEHTAIRADRRCEVGDAGLNTVVGQALVPLQREVGEARGGGIEVVRVLERIEAINTRQADARGRLHGGDEFGGQVFVRIFVFVFVFALAFTFALTRGVAGRGDHEHAARSGTTTRS